MQIISLKEIKSILPKVDLMKEIEKGFANYSKGNVVQNRFKFVPISPNLENEKIEEIDIMV